jgi:ferric-chelate reductase [NAD(P)H]
MDLKALQKIQYGMYIVTSKGSGRINGQIANTVFQVTSEPCTIAVSISKKNLTHELITESRVFGVSALSTEATMPFIGQFGFKSGRNIDKFANVKFRQGSTGSPIVLDFSVAFFEAEVVSALDCGTHTLFLGRMTDAGLLGEAEAMSYSYYHKIKGGFTPANAPTYAGKGA